MIKAVFINKGGKTAGFTISGHAGYEESGNDIVCAGVSSAVMLTANAITEKFKVKAEVLDKNNEISLRLLEENEQASLLLEALKEHIGLISNEFSGTISIENMEV